MAKTLHYDFAGDKSLVAKTGPPLSITRATDATYFDSSGVMQTAVGGVARFDHLPVSPFTSLGLLVEEARTNICLYSEDLSNAAWVASNVTKGSTSVTAPDGTANTAVRLTASAGNGTILQSITSASATRAYSVYMKRVTGTGNIDLTVDGGLTWTTKTLTADWTRFDITQAAVANPQVGVRIVTSGDAIDFWGASLEAGAFPTSYIPTTTASVTRNADNVQTTDISWHNANGPGTFYASAVHSLVNTAGSIIDLGSGNTERYSYSISATGGHRVYYRANNLQQVDIDSSNAWEDTDVHRLALGHDVNDFAGYFDGASIGTDSSVTLADPGAEFSVGKNLTDASHINGHIAEIRYYDERLDNATLEAMSNGEFPSEGNDFYIAVTRRTANQMRPKQRLRKPKHGLFR